MDIENNRQHQFQQQQSQQVQQVNQNQQIYIQKPIKTLKHSYLQKQTKWNKSEIQEQQQQQQQQHQRSYQNKSDQNESFQQDYQDGNNNNSYQQYFQEIEQNIQNFKPSNEQEELLLNQQIKELENYRNQQNQQSYQVQQDYQDDMEVEEYNQYQNNSYQNNSYQVPEQNPRHDNSNREILQSLYNGLIQKQQNQQLVQQNSNKVKQQSNRLSGREMYDRIVQDKEIHKHDTYKQNQQVQGMFNFEDWVCTKEAIPISDQSLWKDKPDLRLKRVRQCKQQIGEKIVIFLKTVLFDNIQCKDDQKNEIYESYFYEFLDETHKYDLEDIIQSGDKLIQKQKQECNQICKLFQIKCNEYVQKIQNMNQYSFNIFKEQINDRCLLKILKISDIQENQLNLDNDYLKLIEQYKYQILNNEQNSDYYKTIRKIIKNGQYRSDYELLQKISQNIENSLIYYKIINDFEQQAISLKKDLDNRINKQEYKLQKLYKNIQNFMITFQDDSKLNYFKNKIQQALKRAELPEYEYFNSDTNANQQVISKRYNITLKIADLRTLLPQKWLNDNIINCYAKLLMEKTYIMNNNKKELIIINSQFFDKFFQYQYNNPQIQVCSQSFNHFFKKFRLQNNSIFLDYKKVGFIICVENHWIFIGVDNVSQKILYYDSMPHSVGDKFIQYSKAIKILIKKENDNNEEFKTQRKNVLYKEEQVKCPQQDNGYDCGVFVCKNMQQFVYQDEQAENYIQKQITEFRRNLYYLFPLLSSSTEIPDFDVIDYLEKGQNSNLIFDQTLKKNKKALQN